MRPIKQYQLTPRTIELLELSAYYFGLTCCGKAGNARKGGRRDSARTCSLAQYMALNETQQEQLYNCSN